MLTSALKVLTLMWGPVSWENMRLANTRGAGRATEWKEPGPGQCGLADGSLLWTLHLPLDFYIREK